MNHGVRKSKLGRPTKHRLSLLKSLSLGLVSEGRLTTTLPRAKALRSFVEPLLSLSRVNTLQNHKRLAQVFPKQDVRKNLFDVIGPELKKRSGGYLRIMKRGVRLGDAAPRAIIEFVDSFTCFDSEKKEKKS